MARQSPPQPTPAELEVLGVLWEHGSATLRQIHNAILVRRSISLNTTLKTVQIMTEKGLLLRDSESYPSQYRPAVEKSRMQGRLINDLIRRAFDGSPGQLLIRAVKEGGLSDQELREVQRLIRQARKAREDET